MRLYLCTPDREAEVLADLPAASDARLWAPGIVEWATDSEPPGTNHALDPIFARQVLPAAHPVQGESIRELAEAAYAVCEPEIDRSHGPWAVHAFVLDPDADPPLAHRATLVGETLIELFDQRRRRAARRRTHPAALPELARSHPAGPPPFHLVQILLADRTAGFASAAPARPVPGGGTDLSPFVGGRAPVQADRTAPSRAYRKLEEAFAWLGHSPAADQRVVDLGGSPGGWAWAALKRGAHVLAVDRSPLDPPAAGHARLDARIGDAFKFQPERPVDWLLCDVIAEPQRSIDLIARWLAGRWFRRAVVTVKFRGRDGYGVLGELAEIFARHSDELAFTRIKHMAWNQNEVVVLIERID